MANVPRKARSAKPPAGDLLRMPELETLRVLSELRGEEIVVTTMGSARDWPKLSEHPLDFHYIPSAMGQAPAIGLGLALAQPEREVWVLNGDGCMLMNVGHLVTIAAARPANLTVFVLENSIYEVTGGQQTAAAAAEVDFCGFARAAGFPCVMQFDDLEDWRQRAAETLRLPGPRFVLLRVEPVGEDYLLESPGPMKERIAKFRQALGVG